MSLVEAFSFFICFLDDRLGANSEHCSLLLMKTQSRIWNYLGDCKQVASYKYLKRAINFQY